MVTGCSIQRVKPHLKVLLKPLATKSVKLIEILIKFISSKPLTSYATSTHPKNDLEQHTQITTMMKEEKKK